MCFAILETAPLCEHCARFSAGFTCDKDKLPFLKILISLGREIVVWI